MFSFNQILEKINSHIAGLDYAREPMGLYDPIKYELSLGGKRLRPSLMLMAYNLYREDIENILDPAAAIEIYHNYTLLHDDLMDDADMRRGKPTVHIKWDDNTAILSGDAMLVLAYQYVSKVDAAHLPEVLKVFSQTAMEICEGQQLDVDFESRNDVKDTEYLEMIRLKTAVLLAAALKIGAILGGAEKEDARNLYLFGQSMGLAFQLKDDLLDVYGDPRTFGKNIGGDIVSNKKTYMLIKALENANDEQRKELEKWIAAKEFDHDEKIKAVTKLYDEIGVREICERKMADYSEEALTYLSNVSVESIKKMELRKTLDKMMRREV